jgi:hypothetical protein
MRKKFGWGMVNNIGKYNQTEMTVRYAKGYFKNTSKTPEM